MTAMDELMGSSGEMGEEVSVLDLRDLAALWPSVRDTPDIDGRGLPQRRAVQHHAPSVVLAAAVPPFDRRDVAA